jgi:hypothetical protein
MSQSAIARNLFPAALLVRCRMHPAYVITTDIAPCGEKFGAKVAQQESSRRRASATVYRKGPAPGRT